MTLFGAALLAVMNVEPAPMMAIIGVVVWGAFLISVPARGHEPVPPRSMNTQRAQ